VSTPLGNPMTYFEWRTLAGLANMTHLVNFIVTGIFEDFPDLKVTLVEGGYSWLLYFKHRLNQLYKSLRAETPWLKRSPEEYLHKHIRFTTQPVEEIEIDELEIVFKSFDADKLLVFSSDYPHWDADDPIFARKYIPSKFHDDIFFNNANGFYNLGL
jgi:predicted TIM-barrel fold metal-dependent hydrolase